MNKSENNQNIGYTSLVLALEYKINPDFNISELPEEVQKIIKELADKIPD